MQTLWRVAVNCGPDPPAKQQIKAIRTASIHYFSKLCMFSPLLINFIHCRCELIAIFLGVTAGDFVCLFSLFYLHVLRSNLFWFVFPLFCYVRYFM